jgi:hypothetical protein
MKEAMTYCHTTASWRYPHPQVLQLWGFRSGNHWRRERRKNEKDRKTSSENVVMLHIKVHTKTRIWCQSCTAAAGASGLTVVLGWTQVLRPLFGLLDIGIRRAPEEEASWHFTDSQWDVEFGGQTEDAVSHGVRVCALRDRHTGSSVGERLDFGFESVVELQIHTGGAAHLASFVQGDVFELYW